MNVVVIIQARMGSTRLPAKVLMDLGGQPVLARVVNRARRARRVDKVVVATTDLQLDDAIADYCRVNGWSCFRGEENDVLNRYYKTACRNRADVVVRITADCPLIEPEIIDRVVADYLAHAATVDYVSNVHPVRTYPRGLDVEVMSFDALVRAEHEDDNPAWREHVTVYLQRNPALFTMRNITDAVDHSDQRWTVDTLEDLTFVRRIYSHFQNDAFGWREVLDLLGQHPEWLEINGHIQQVVVD